MAFNFSRNRSIKSMLASGMPNMSQTLNGWEVPLTLVRIIQDVDEGDLTYKDEKINFMGVFQPMSMEQLQLLPEGQRSWSHYWIHCKSGTLNLETADKIIFNNKMYKVIEKKDYSLNGYVEYHVITDYKNTNE